MTMEFTSREVIAQLLHVILHIFVEQAYKTHAALTNEMNLVGPVFFYSGVNYPHVEVAGVSQERICWVECVNDVGETNEVKNGEVFRFNGPERIAMPHAKIEFALPT